jgi:hypothetical protein
MCLCPHKCQRHWSLNHCSDFEFNRVKETFNKLVQNCYVKRAYSVAVVNEDKQQKRPAENSTESDTSKRKPPKIPTFVVNSSELYIVPELKINGKALWNPTETGRSSNNQSSICLKKTENVKLTKMVMCLLVK